MNSIKAISKNARTEHQVPEDPAFSRLGIGEPTAALQDIKVYLNNSALSQFKTKIF